MKTQVATLEASDNAAIAEEGKKAVEMEENVSKLLTKRKRIATNMLNAISESSFLKKSDLVDTMDCGADSCFKSTSSMSYRELTDEEKEKLQKQVRSITN
ncbi:hypothetical protein OESDEN_09292 [Oesophagostomum dentatum]|uniref:Uncharacterized protein n=1 Tax=Oesophagostomum dentatum TaxID=61180 RepID=A0A0B1T0T5_OESDE|nr:hypothetical protein OESDEN_09292 [Oesophagostomum dentatum]